MTNLAVLDHFGHKNIELAIALEALAHVGRRPVRDAASKGILRKSAGVKIGNSQLLKFAKYLIYNYIKIRFAIQGGSQEKRSQNLKDFVTFFVSVSNYSANTRPSPLVVYEFL